MQKHATKLVPDLRQLTYSDRLSALNLPRLLYRQRKMDMITVFKIVHGLEGVPFDNLFTFNMHNAITRGSGYKLFKHFSHLNVQKFSFAERIKDDCNQLPTFLIESPDIATDI